MNITDFLLNLQALLQVSAVGILLLCAFHFANKRFHLETRTRGVLVAGGVVTCLGCLYFFLLYWNHFLGLRSGNGAYGGGMSYLSGLRPYRDYYCAVTPLDILKWAAVLKVFGTKLIVVRAFAVLDRLMLASLLYLWLLRLFRARDAALATMVTIVVSAGDISDPLASYNHDTIFLAMLSGFLASFALDEQRSEKWIGGLGLLSGVVACLSFASKQTIGLAITTAIPIVVGAALLRLDGLRRGVMFVGGFVLGWLGCAGVFTVWLMQTGLWPAFVQQVFQQGPSAKASHPSDFLYRALLISRYLHAEIVVAVAAIVLGAKPIWNSINSDDHRKNYLQEIAAVIAVPVLAYFAAMTTFNLPDLDVLRFSTVIMAPLASLIVGLYCFYRWLWGKLNRRHSQFLLLAAVSFSASFMLSLSWPFFEAMLVPSLALIVAAMLDGINGHWRKVVYLALGVILFAQVHKKLAAPFGFAGWFEGPVTAAVVNSESPALEGLRLPRDTVNLIDGSVRIVNQYSSPTDTIFTYPEMGLIYSLTSRRSATFSWSHNIDVVSSQMARDEAARLLAAKPAVLFYGAESPLAIRTDELLWRGGKESGQRDLIRAVDSLAKAYCLKEEFQVPGGHIVRAYVRPDLAKSECTH